MNILIVRHTSVGVPKGTCYGWSDVPVSETFEEEAGETLKNLYAIKEELGIEEFDVVLSSPLTRTLKLASFCGYPAPLTDERLREMGMGDWEMANYDYLWQHDSYFKQWLKAYATLPTPHGESFPQFYARVTKVFDELRQAPVESAIIFAHGGVCTCGGIYAGLFDVRHAYTEKNMIPYGGIEVITV